MSFPEKITIGHLSIAPATVLAPTGANEVGIGASLGLQFMDDTTEASIGDADVCLGAVEDALGSFVKCGYYPTGR